MNKLARIILVSAIVFGAASAMARKVGAAGPYSCQAMDVFEYSNSGTPLLMVECSNLYTTGVNWTAIQITSSTSVQTQVNRFTTMAISAVLSGRKFKVWMTDTACPNNSNCRIASEWALSTM
jgi:hypothetical protein